MIEKLTKRRVEVETILWDGTDERANEIKQWVGLHQVGTGLESAFFTAAELDSRPKHAQRGR